jgi:hypothetical protein
MQRGSETSLELITGTESNNVGLAMLISRVAALEKENKKLKEQKCLIFL